MTTAYPTYPYPPVQPPHPPVQPPRKNHTKLAIVVVTGLATLALSVLVIAGVHSSLPPGPHTADHHPG